MAPSDPRISVQTTEAPMTAHEAAGIEPGTTPTKSDLAYHLLKRLAVESPAPIHYGHLAALIDSPRWRLGVVLSRVRGRCHKEHLPDLTAFVVKQNGYPADGFGDDPELAASIRKAAFDYLSKPYWSDRKAGSKWDVDAFRYGPLP